MYVLQFKQRINKSWIENNMYTQKLRCIKYYLNIHLTTVTQCAIIYTLLIFLLAQ